MSDCTNGGRFSYDAQTHVKPRQANMRKLGEPPYEIEMPDTWIFPSEITELVDAITWRGRRFVRERTCKPVEEYLDDYSDLTVTVCSNCRVTADDLEDCYYCPNCGAKVLDE